MSRSINLAVIPGDGIGQEVVAEGLKVLSAVLPQDVKLETQDYDFCAQRYHATGETLTDADLDSLKKLTLVHKNNVLTFAGHLWTNIFNKVAQEFPEVTTDYVHVDAATIYLVTDPARFDVIVTDNLFGDIITDLAAAVSGGIGVAASGNLDITRRNPSMFEPVHGSAPDIAGQGLADPTAAVLSVSLLLDHLGQKEAARRIEASVAFDLATRDQSSPGATQAIGDRLAALGSSN